MPDLFDYQNHLLTLESRRTTLEDMINHFDDDNRHLNPDEKKEQLGQLTFSLQLCNETIERTKQHVEELIHLQ